MATCEQPTTFTTLDLPDEFEDLAGLLHTDLHAIVTMLSQRAHERLLLTGREYQRLQQTLWNSLTEAVNVAVEPLTAERR